MEARNEAVEIQHELELIRGSTGKPVFPAPLRERAVAWYTARKAAGCTGEEICRELGIGSNTLRRWFLESPRPAAPKRAASRASFVPVRVVDPTPSSAMRVFGPAGIRIEGLDLTTVVELLREALVIGSTRRVRVYVYAAPTDMRKSFDALAALVTEQMARDVLAGEMFLFVSRDRRKARVLFYDGTGMCLYCKRLARGQFTSPWDPGAGGSMTQSELSLFLEGSTLAGTIPLSPPVVSSAPAVSREQFESMNSF